MSNFPDGAYGAVMDATAGHDSRCEDNVWYECPQDGVFDPITLGRGENICPQCKQMCARAWCVCGQLPDEWSD